MQNLEELKKQVKIAKNVSYVQIKLLKYLAKVMNTQE